MKTNLKRPQSGNRPNAQQETDARIRSTTWNTVLTGRKAKAHYNMLKATARHNSSHIICLYVYDTQNRQIRKNQWFWAERERASVGREE